MSLESPLDDPVARVVSADGTKIWAAQAGRKAGEAPVLLLVPGFACISTVFTRQFEDQSLLDKFCLITYEPRGQGRSGQPTTKEDYSSQKNAEDFKAVCDYFGAKRVVLAGWSYGGLIACDVITHLGAEWLAGSIYLAGIPWRSMHPEVAHHVIMELIPRLLASDTETFHVGITDFVNSCFLESNVGTIPYSLWAAIGGAAAVQSPTARFLMMTERHQDETKLLEIADSLDVMLVVGNGDRHMYADKFDGFIRKTFGKSDVVVVEEAGHAAFWEQSEIVNGAIEGFVDRVWA